MERYYILHKFWLFRIAEKLSQIANGTVHADKLYGTFGRPDFCSDVFFPLFPDKFPLPAQHPPRPFDQVEERELERDGESQVRRVRILEACMHILPQVDKAERCLLREYYMML